MYYEKKELSRFLVSTEISSEILERLKKSLEVSVFTLAIDDWIHGSSLYVQNILSRYFDLFDKVVITTDDFSLNEPQRQLELQNKGYTFLTSTYGKNVEVIKQIIRRRIKLYNEGHFKIFFDENVMTDMIYSILVTKASGNISIILDTFSEIVDLFDFKDGCIQNLEGAFEREINHQLGKTKRLRKINANLPKLHL